MGITQKHFDALMDGRECAFWDKEGDIVHGKLTGIRNTKFFKYTCDKGQSYNFCKPLPKNKELFKNE